MILRLSSSTLRFLALLRYILSFEMLFSLPVSNLTGLCLSQDDAIRNLFSAKTIHEFSAQSLLAFLVELYVPFDSLTSILIMYFKNLFTLRGYV